MHSSSPYDSQDAIPVWRSLQAMLFWLVLLGAVAHLAYTYPQLPERVATHFGSGGRADAWGSKQSFALTYGLLVGGLGLLFFAIAFFLPRLPASIINIPNREYWLAPERREATLHHVGREMLVMGTATMAFIVATFHFSMLASIGGTDRLGPGFWIVLVAFLIYAGIWSLRLMLRFRLPGR